MQEQEPRHDQNEAHHLCAVWGGMHNKKKQKQKIKKEKKVCLVLEYAMKNSMNVHKALAAKAVTCVILAIQCIMGASATQQTEVAIIESSCASHNYWRESISGFLILCIILGIILWVLDFLAGLFYERYRHVRRDVQCQAPTTYTALRGSATPRFLPLSEQAWG